MKSKKITLKNILAALFGVFFVSVGVAFNNCAGLGNDPIGMLYDGIRVIGHLTPEQLGIATDIVNVALAVLLFFIGRRYINIGTLIYLLPYGVFVNVGTYLYQILSFSNGLWVRILFSIVGSLILYMGVAVYIIVDIGVDPFTGIVLRICEATHKEYRAIKVPFDLSMIVIGVLLGGKIGVVTIITALAAGPLIQFFTNFLKDKIEFIK